MWKSSSNDFSDKLLQTGFYTLHTAASYQCRQPAELTALGNDSGSSLDICLHSLVLIYYQKYSIGVN